jgi:predicted PurR-regulated permease PerM
VAANEGVSRAMKALKVRGAFFLIILIAVTAIFLAMLKPFLVSILLAAIFAGLTYPIYDRMRRRWGRAGLCSLACVVLVLLVIILPLIFFLGLITFQALQFKDTVDDRIKGIIERAPEWLERLKEHPLGKKIDIREIKWQEKAAEGARLLSTFLIRSITRTSQSAIQTVAMSFIMLYTLFYFLVDGPALLNRIKYLSPLKDEYEDKIIGKFISITRATIKGTILIGLVQGGMGGITFAICGVGSSVFWGAVMVILSIIPGIGAALVWVPALIIKIVTGHAGQGLGILAGGVLISISDNFLRPLLIGRDTQMHELLILFSTLGGIGLFGIVGFILGPILAAVFITVTDIYVSEYGEELKVLTHGETSASDESEKNAP